MKKRNIVLIVLLILCVVGLSVGLTFLLRKDDSKNEKLIIQNKTTWKVEQTIETLRATKRTIPSTTSNEGLCVNYPMYAGSLSGLTDEEKDNLYTEDKLLRAGTDTYNSMDKDGNLYLNGESINRKLYKHTASVGMYLGEVSNSEPAVVQKVTICQSEDRNYITGVYAPAGEVIKIEISEEDLASIGGLTVTVGQSTHRNATNTIKSTLSNFVRMPNITNFFEVKSTTTYVGSYLGGPIYLKAKNLNKEYTVKISGAVKYPVYIHGYTTKEDLKEYEKYSAPYFDFELQNLGVRHSGPKKYIELDYDNFFKCAELWKKICMTSRQVPSWSNRYVSVGFIYDPYVAAGAACAFTGGNIWVNAPCNWISGGLNYKSMTSDGFWGIIHEFNHHFQSYGLDSYIEVTNNATSLLSYVSYTNISSKRNENENSLTGWNRYTNPIIPLKETISNGKVGQTSLNVYADIIHSFGVETFIRATQNSANNHTADGWFKALCESTHYNMQYYFEELLGYTISDSLKENYVQFPMFVPAALLYQTGRNYYYDDTELFAKTVRPYVITKGQELLLDFQKYLVLPNDFDFEIVNISKPKQGSIYRVDDKKYKYVASNYNSVDNFTVEIKLINEIIETKNIKFTIEIDYADPLPTRTKYTYDTNKYTSCDDALNANFDGYTNKTTENVSTTFMNGIGAKQIGVVEGKIYIPQSADYNICLRAGRGNHSLYISYDGKNYEKIISFSGDKGGFEIGNGHTVVLKLNEGDYLWYKQVTISNGHPDAFTELGWSKDDSKPVTIPSQYLYNVDAKGYTDYSFESEELFEKKYEYSSVMINSSEASKSRVINSNQLPWDNTTKIENILDGEEETFYHSARGNFVSKDNPCEITIDMGEIKTYNNLLITNRKSNTIHMPVEFKLYGGISADSMVLLGDYAGLDYSGYTLNVSFKDASIRFYKLVITDTDAHINKVYDKYVSIAELQMRYVVNNVRQYSADEMDYYGFRIDKGTLGSFGHLIVGNGTIKYNFVGSNFLLYTKNINDCRLRVNVDGVISEVEIKGDKNIIPTVLANNLNNGKHQIEIQVLSGMLGVDSFGIFN